MRWLTYPFTAGAASPAQHGQDYDHFARSLEVSMEVRHSHSVGRYVQNEAGADTAKSRKRSCTWTVFQEVTGSLGTAPWNVVAGSWTSERGTGAKSWPRVALLQLRRPQPFLLPTTSASTAGPTWTPFSI